MDREVAGVGAPDRALRFPFESVPEGGEVTEVADGVLWLRMPLPFSLAFINLWLIRDHDGWAVVDTGINDRKTHNFWTKIIEELGAKITRVVVTHFHPDHIGNAGWFHKQHGAQLTTTRTEYLMCRMALDEAADDDLRGEAELWMTRNGYPDDMRAMHGPSRKSGFRKMVSRLPLSYQRVSDGDAINIGGRQFEVMVGRGHAPEHLCLYCRELNIFISGDQILPKISSNVSVSMMEPEANPLKEWLDSCERLKRDLPEDVLVLPAHNEPFYGAHLRLQDLIDGHEEGMAALLEECKSPCRSVDVFMALFGRNIRNDQFGLAVGEAMAHLNCLVSRGQMARTTDTDGAWRFATI